MAVMLSWTLLLVMGSCHPHKTKPKNLVHCWMPDLKSFNVSMDILGSLGPSSFLSSSDSCYSKTTHGAEDNSSLNTTYVFTSALQDGCTM